MMVKVENMSTETEPSESGLKKTLGPVMLWGLGVGYVISGEYFGWNLGLPEGGTYGMLAATALITLMYVTFVFSYVELACAMPKAGGAFVYATRALGPLGGSIAGFVQVIEFVFAPPAIAMAIAAYIHQRFDVVDPHLIAIAAYLMFTGLNIWGVKQAAIFELAITILAVAELLVFFAIVGPEFKLVEFQKEALPNGWGGVFACLPFAIWFYLAIEGVANAAEETRDPQRNVAIGFSASMVTLVVLAVGVFFVACGVEGWRAIVFEPGSTEPSDAPLPLALALVVEKTSIWYTLLLGVGLLGLIASFHGIILVAGRATMELGRSDIFPKILGRVHPKTGTPIAALCFNLVVGVIAILSGKTGEIITLACLGAVSLYIVSMISLFVLRRREPDLERPFKAVAYPVFPALACGIAVISLISISYYNPIICAIFVGLVASGCAYSFLSARGAKP